MTTLRLCRRIGYSGPPSLIFVRLISKYWELQYFSLEYFRLNVFFRLGYYAGFDALRAGELERAELALGAHVRSLTTADGAARRDRQALRLLGIVRSAQEFGIWWSPG